MRSTCRVQLLEAIDAVDDSTHQRFFIGCLMHSADAATRSRARALLPPPPEFGAGVGYTYEEVEYLNLRDNVVYARERAAEVVALLRPN